MCLSLFKKSMCFGPSEPSQSYHEVIEAKLLAEELNDVVCALLFHTHHTTLAL